MGIILQNDWRSRAIFITILIMLAGLFSSRAILSISFISFTALTLVHKEFISQLRSFFRHPYLISITFLFLIPFVSGLWSDDKAEWLDLIRTKLPFLILPICFAGDWKLRPGEWTFISWTFLIIVVLGCGWSFFQYLQDTAVINESYLRAKTIPTPLKDDHVRFSWLVAVAVLLSILLFEQRSERFQRAILSIIILYFLIYLHVLSARTGLLMAYFSLIAYAIFVAGNAKRRLLLVGIAILLSIVSWWIFPTLKNRMKYSRYDLSFIHKENSSPGTSDANRMISINAGWDILQQNPFGVGGGDVRSMMEKWYAQHTPGILAENKLYPSSEWLAYGTIAGWPAVVLFSILICVPFFIRRIQQRFFWIVLHCMAISCFFFETSLETQFGIFIYCFVSLWWWKWLKAENK